MSKNPCGRLVSPENAYEVWQTEEGQWTYFVLKKHKSQQREKEDPSARWYVAVQSPAFGEGRFEYGDMTHTDVKRNARQVDNPLCSSVCVRLDNHTTISPTHLQKFRYIQLREKHAQLVNYLRIAVPKKKVSQFKQLARKHNMTIVCIDDVNEVQKCLNDFTATLQQEEV